MRSNSLALVIAAIFAAGCNAHSEVAREDVRPVRTIAVGATAGSVGATYPGEVRARHETKLGFKIGGRIAQRMVEVGAHVQPGQVLMRLDPEQEVLRNVSAGAHLDGARSRYEQARVDLQRTQELFARKFASQAELDHSRLAFSEAEAQLSNARAQKDIASNNRAYTELRADRAGVVTAINAEAGQVVASGQPVLVVAGDGEREVVVSIPESRIGELRDARRMTISLWAYPGKTYLGKLRELSPDTDEVTRTYAARITIQAPGPEVRLGMTASVFTPDVEGTRAIRLPLSAIVDTDGKPRVWVVDGTTSRVSARAVQLGAAEKDSVLIAGGVSAGDIVVTAGVNQLNAGQKVKVAGSKS